MVHGVTVRACTSMCNTIVTTIVPTQWEQNERQDQHLGDVLIGEHVWKPKVHVRNMYCPVSTIAQFFRKQCTNVVSECRLESATF